MLLSIDCKGSGNDKDAAYYFMGVKGFLPQEKADCYRDDRRDKAIGGYFGYIPLTD